ncbi:MAG TPA: hypothetical protein VEL79_21715 [Vicinamibacterales bacterium]|nr:hypothetical protein [Vicinamibacterales bacterium]
MPAKDIPREHWAEFLDTFSRQHRAWLTTIEPSVRGVEARPLRAVEPVREGGVLSAIEIVFAGDASGDTVRVERPIALRLRQTPEGADQAIEITDDEGFCTRVGFRTTSAPSDMLDGIAPGELIDSDRPGRKG